MMKVTRKEKAEMMVKIRAEYPTCIDSKGLAAKYGLTLTQLQSWTSKAKIRKTKETMSILAVISQTHRTDSNRGETPEIALQDYRPEWRAEPTRSHPGTPEKLDILAQRVQDQEELHAVGDLNTAID
jgi:hypothetical protein